MTLSRAARQRFSIGYHLNSWDLTGQPLRPAIKFLADQGFGWFEILAFTSLSDQYARKYMQLGNQAPMGVTTDTDILRRYALLSEGQSNYGIRLSSFYVNAIFTNPVAWPYERDVLLALTRLLKGFGSPVLVVGEAARKPSPDLTQLMTIEPSAVRSRILAADARILASKRSITLTWTPSSSGGTSSTG